ncbi:MAG: hypothetical protein WA001_00070 [Patescibacteria group bacterium]
MGDKFKDTLAGLVLLALFLGASFFKRSIGLVVDFLGLFAILFHVYLLGKRLFPKIDPVVATLAALVPFFAIQSVAQTAWFYANSKLGDTSDLWCAAIAMAVSLVVYVVVHEKETTEDSDKKKPDAKNIAYGVASLAISLIACAFVVIVASRRATMEAILTPWTILPPGIIPALVLGWLSVFVSVRLAKSRWLAATQAALALFATTSITPLLYSLGYGFDGFLHVATEKIILATGTLTPKPFYYIGQYVFTTWISRIAGLPIDQVDRWLVPAATALLLPLALFLVSDKDEQPWSVFLLFLVPLAPFIATTPQSFAYLLGFAALLLCRGLKDESIHPLAPLFIAAWAVAIHPLAGLPIILIVMALIIGQRPQKKYDWFRHAETSGAWLFILASAVAVPIAFYILSLHGTTPINWNLSSIFTWQPWGNLFTNLSPWIGNRFVVWPAWASLASQALPLLLLAAAFASLFNRDDEHRQMTALLLGAAILLFIAAAILKTAGDFAFLIDYERGNYADRLNLLALFCLVPAAMPFLERALGRIGKISPLLSATFLASCLALAAAQSFNALPRNDALVTGHGWSVGQSDIAAVKAIDRDAGSQPYTVLADQSISAEAVSQLGFKRYNGDVFFYPIPTGGPLYDEFLQMTYQQPSLDTVVDASKLGGTDLVYVVVNDYWWNAANLEQELSAISEQQWTFGDTTQGLGNVDYVFKFDASKPVKAATAN